MKKFTHSFLVLLFALSVCGVFAQKPTTTQGVGGKQKTYVRCATDEAIEHRMQTDPEFRAMMQKREKDYQDFLLANRNNPTPTLARTTALTGPVTIPVVVHIVLPNPNIITDADVQYFINRLNLDYSGLNPDSANGAPFYGVRGHSLLRFQLARRDPSGNYTTGIERKVGTAGIMGGEPQPLKSTTTGGLNPWPFQQYYNLWVGADASGQGILGIAPNIGPGTAASDGVCVNYEAFSNSSCGYTIPAFNLGRTAVHEIGHNFGLFHTFSGCTNGADFAQLTSAAGCTLPNALLAGSDDTPNQSNSTSGCPTGTVASNCAGVSSKMYQNYMDYTDDACYSMFTKGQVERMHYVLEFCRGGGYLTTQGHLPPASMPTLDISAMDVVSPGGSELIGCTATAYPAPSCPGTFVPKVRIENRGSTTLTSVTVALSINSSVVATQTFNVNIATYANAVVTFTTPQPLATGSNVITYTVSAPNGGSDQVATNNTVSSTVNIATAIAAPLSESFEGGTFPPANWTLTQLSGAGNWARVTTAAKTGSASAKFDNYNFQAGATSALTTPALTFASTATTASLSFHYAHRTFSGEPDRLEVLISTNCGSTWTSLWARQGATGTNALVTVTGNLTTAFTPTATQWTSTPVEIDLTAYKSQTVQIQFKATSGYGNNLYLDDINILGTTAVAIDAGVTAINVPLASFCGSSFTPQVVVKNFGTTPLTSVSVRYAVNPAGNGPTGYAVKAFTGLNVPLNGTTTLTLDPVTGFTTGTHNFRAYTELPNGVTDQQLTNDFLVKSFTANVPTTTFPVTQDFEAAWTGTAAAPVLTNGWAVLNPDAGTTWTRSTAAAKSGTASGRLNNYAYNAIGQLDYLRSPSLNFTGKDSAYVTFHYAYKLYAAADADTLEVVLSTDCGATWTSLWKKGGSDLITTTGTGGANFVPTATQWSQTPVFINLESYINSGPLFIAFRNNNDFGQSLWLDDINIVGKLLNDNDAALASIIQPTNDVCVTNPAPSVRVRNSGRLTINSIKVGYTINGGAVVSQTFPVSIARAKDTVLTLNPIAGLTAGTTYAFKIFTFEPNGVVDQNLTNDTLSKSFGVKVITTAPLVEGFEGTFPPANWEVTETPVNTDKWIQNITALASTGTASASIKNFNVGTATSGSVDYLTSPVVNFASTSDSVFLKFDVAAATTQYPGSTALGLDTLEVLVTTDCGVTWSSVYKKWGADLQTVNNPNDGYQGAFVPNTKANWRKDSVNLTSYLASGGTARFRFKNTTNNGNNIYIDNVNFASKTLSSNVKTNGYAIAPNPVGNVLTIQHYRTPTTLKGIGVYNSVGQRLMYINYNSNAEAYIPINVSALAAGIYTVKLEYTNKTVSQKIVKL